MVGEGTFWEERGPYLTVALICWTEARIQDTVSLAYFTIVPLLLCTLGVTWYGIIRLFVPIELLIEAEAQPFDSLCQNVKGVAGLATHRLTTDPSSDPVTPSSPESSPPSPCEGKGVSNNTALPCVHHTLRSLNRHRQGLTVLLVLLGLVLVGFIVLLLVKVLSNWRTRRPRNHKYKSVSRYFPFSYEKQATEVVIPAVGIPKTGATERQVLLNESDEDEL